MVGWYHQLNGHEFEQTSDRIVKDREAWPAAIHGVTKSCTRLSNLTELNGTESNSGSLIHLFFFHSLLNLGT